MTNISIPFWIFAVSVGLPCLSLLCWVGFFLRKIRSPNADQFESMLSQDSVVEPSTSRPFHCELLGKQIDAVFTGMNAIIETERLKIQALLVQPNSALFGSLITPAETAFNQKVTPSNLAATPDPTREQKVIARTNTGEHTQHDAIADELCLSQTEIDLAMSMRSSREQSQGRKLEAVA